MKDFKPICVDDIIESEAYGKIQVTDLFVSPRTQRIVYAVLVIDAGSALQDCACIATEDELYVKPANP